MGLLADLFARKDCSECFAIVSTYCFSPAIIKLVIQGTQLDSPVLPNATAVVAFGNSLRANRWEISEMNGLEGKGIRRPKGLPVETGSLEYFD